MAGFSTKKKIKALSFFYLRMENYSKKKSFSFVVILILCVRRDVDDDGAVFGVVQQTTAREANGMQKKRIM